MRTPFSFMGGTQSITTSANWTVEGTNSTLTVPTGTGTIKFTITVSDADAQYSKNNAAYVTFVTNNTLAVANNDTLKFRENPAAGGPPDFVGNVLRCNVIDNTTGATVGTVTVG